MAGTFVLKEAFVAGVHPSLGHELAQPVLHAGDPASAVFLDVLFTDQPDRDFPAGRVGDGDAELPFALIDAVGVVPECPMTKVTEQLLGLIEPLVDMDVVFGDASELPSTALAVIPEVAH